MAGNVGHGDTPDVEMQQQDENELQEDWMLVTTAFQNINIVAPPPSRFIRGRFAIPPNRSWIDVYAYYHATRWPCYLHLSYWQEQPCEVYFKIVKA